MTMFLLLTSLAAASDVTPQNRQTHPEITEIRLLRKAIEKESAHPTWRATKENVTTCVGQYVKKRATAQDQKGTIRRYKAEGSQDGIAFWTTQYYDHDGKLRFVHLKLTHTETDATANYTSFLDVHGARLFEHVQRTTDDEKRLPSGVPEKYIMARPDQAMANQNPCG